MLVELGKPADIEHLLTIENDAFFVNRISRDRMRRFLNKNDRSTVLLVAREREVPTSCVGYILVLFNARNRIARIHSYAINPSYRGTGLGAELIERGCRAALDRGCNLIRTEVRATSPHALGRYEKSGFRHCGQKDDYYADGCTALSYERALISDKKDPSF